MAKIILLALAVVLVTFLVIRLQGSAYARFKANAGEVMGVIEKKETRIEAGHSKRAGSGENVLMYNYVVDGTKYHGEEAVEYDDLWLDARDGMELRVYYDKKNPAKSYPAALIDRRIKIAGTR